MMKFLNIYTGVLLAAQLMIQLYDRFLGDREL